jgi:hypothetical protein
MTQNFNFLSRVVAGKKSKEEHLSLSLMDVVKGV